MPWAGWFTDDSIKDLITGSYAIILWEI